MPNSYAIIIEQIYHLSKRQNCLRWIKISSRIYLSNSLGERFLVCTFLYI